LSETSSARLRGGPEVVQPAVIRLYNNLVQVYRVMRERQSEIDAAFDRVAAQIGFVVTTTLPVRVEVGEEGAIKGAAFDGDALKGTIFDKELSGFLRQLTQKPFSVVPAGSYRFYLIWFDALNLKLRFDWYESAHILQGLLGSIVSERGAVSASALFRPEVQESAHWFDPGYAIAMEEAVVILAIDQVNPELRLAERISAGRLAVAQLAWGWHHAEMAPFPTYFNEMFAGREQDILAQVRSMLGRQSR